ncbi:LA2681 family HEPN domain-containing protein [Marinimicrobium agarilyticum]|uniref:LA2681 family HEPN domain-containing protein n=1 Tax=Marinimicrobium agarilyticum TaxID=306546 RepID=UPI000427470C|nr:LA2681 family HEPN domain-containing protein [Marinimicrobium agarilyticum]
MGKGLQELSSPDALEFIGGLIDSATDKALPEQARQALDHCDALEERLGGTQRVELDYFRANAWSVIRQAKHSDESAVWEWDQPEILNEIFYLRSAVRSTQFSSLGTFRQCQMLVNLGNILSHIGRPIEAIEYWARALTRMPKFAMALGNLGFGLETFAKYLYDPGHQVVILKEACGFLKSVAEPGAVWDREDYRTVAQSMLKKAEAIEAHVDFSRVESISLSEHSLGRSKMERQYRVWALDNGLFLSPLNDLGAYPIAAHDVLHLPAMVRPLSEPPHYIGFFNQLKQEYATARFFCWQGITSTESYKKHYSDKGVFLLDTLDYPVYSKASEEIKVAFRMAYSLFDKIAFFINEYWTLGLQERSINFQSVWLEGGTKGKPKRLRVKFQGHQNLPLRGLYWLSKDFVESGRDTDAPVLGETMEPDAYKLRSTRNHLEHKYLKVHDDMWGYTDRSGNSMFDDQWAAHLSMQELQQKALRILKMARCGLTYLSLAVHREEGLRRSQSPDGIAVPMSLPRWE